VLTISSIAKEKKNSLTDTGSWLLLIDLFNQDESVHISICSNTEDVTWNSTDYIAFPFDIDDVPETSHGQLPTIGLKVSNVQRIVQGYVENDPDYGSGWKVELRVVHTSNIESSTPEIALEFTSLSVGADESFVTFQLGMPNPIRMQFPRRKFLPNACQHTFKDSGCGYTLSKIVGVVTQVQILLVVKLLLTVVRNLVQMVELVILRTTSLTMLYGKVWKCHQKDGITQVILMRIV